MFPFNFNLLVRFGKLLQLEFLGLVHIGMSKVKLMGKTMIMKQIYFSIGTPHQVKIGI